MNSLQMVLAITEAPHMGVKTAQRGDCMIELLLSISLAEKSQEN